MDPEKPMGLPDYHTHTARCGHAVGTPAEYVAAARAAGLTGLGVADHIPLLPDPDPVLSMSLEELDAYVREVEELKGAYPGYVLLGIEADYRPHTVAQVSDLLAEYPFDYVIGSVHHLGDWGFDDPRQLAGYETRDIDALWAEYLELVGDAAESGLFTILGHLDLLKKFGYRPSQRVAKQWERLVARLAKTDVVVEINTAGLHRPVAEVYPALEVLQQLRLAHVPVTFGSDAHHPGEVGRDFDRALELAWLAGYRDFVVFDGQPGGGRAGRRLAPLPAVGPRP